MVDVLLVNPPCSRLAFTGGVCRTYMPLGLGYLASGLLRYGFTVEALDSDVMGFDEKKAVDFILKEDPKVVGLSVMSTTLRSSYLIVSSLKKAGFKGEVVAGGPHVTALPQAVSDMGLEYGILGEGEESLVRLCQHIIDETYDVDEIGAVYSPSKKAAEAQFIRNLDELPCPARNLFPVEKYSHISLITSRGCPMKCTYCLMPTVPFRSRSPENVAAEIKHVVEKYGARNLSFVDDNFTFSKERTLTLCALIKEMNLGVSFNCQTRPDLLDEEVVSALKACGCRYIFFGVESGSQEIREKTGKNISDEDFIKAFSLCRRSGIKTRAYFMLGFPGETRADLEKTLSFPSKVKPDDVDYSVTEILPGSELSRELLKEGVIKGDVWEKYMLGEKEYPVYVPEGLSRKELYGLCIEGYRRFYFSSRQLAQKIAQISSVKDFHETLAHTVYTIKAHLKPRVDS